MGDAFRRVGYETWAFGKWHLGNDAPSHVPLGRGYDLCYDATSASTADGARSTTTSFSNRIVHDWHRDGDDSTGPGVDGVHADLLIGRDFADRLAARATGRSSPTSRRTSSTRPSPRASTGSRRSWARDGTFAPRNALDGLDLWPVLSGDRPESALEDRELLHNLDVSRRPALQKLEADVSTCWGLPHAVPPGEQEDCDNFP
ncbi:hypothetical protein JL720_8856 [Aureococcus anophagefferens]|nr:hypothetical protein JL720_8856 [Aureococcus anophagefferens]